MPNSNLQEPSQLSYATHEVIARELTDIIKIVEAGDKRMAVADLKALRNKISAIRVVSSRLIPISKE